MQWYIIHFLPGWSGTEIKCAVLVVQPKRPSLNWFSKVDNRSQDLTVLIFILCFELLALVCGVICISGPSVN